MKIKCITLLTLLLVYSSPALAEGTDPCSQTCPSGQKTVAYGDGNKATCLCVDPGSPMVETVAAEPDGEPVDSSGEPENHDND